jgi:hypothetical protein
MLNKLKLPIILWLIPTLDTDPTSIEVRTVRGSYRRYTEDHVEKLFGLVIEEGKAAKGQI